MYMELKIKKNKQNVYIIELIGELDLYNSHKVKELFSKMIERGINHIIFDLSQTYYIDSTGIGVFIYCFDIAKKQTVKMCLCNVFGTVLKVIQLTKLNQFFTMASTLEDGLDLVRD